MKRFILLMMLNFFLVNQSLFAQINVDYKYFKSALIFKSQDKFKEAIADFSIFIKQYPTQHPIAYYFRGYCHLYTKDYKNALADFQQLAKLEPLQIDAPFSLGITYNKMQEYELAKANFSKALQINPNHAPSLNDRGIARMNLLEHDEAYHDFVKAFTLQPKFAMAYNNAGAARYFNQDIDKPIEKDILQAIQLFTQAIQQDTTLAIAYRNRAIMFILLKKYEAASKDLEVAQTLIPEEPTTYFFKGIVASDQAKYDAAHRFFEQAISLRPQYYLAIEEMGNMEKMKGNHEAAIAIYQRAANTLDKQDKLYLGYLQYKIALVRALQSNERSMYASLKTALRLKAFTDKRVYQDLMNAPELNKYRGSANFRRFVAAATKGKKYNKFLSPSLVWFRMRR